MSVAFASKRALKRILSQIELSPEQERDAKSAAAEIEAATTTFLVGNADPESDFESAWKRFAPAYEKLVGIFLRHTPLDELRALNEQFEETLDDHADANGWRFGEDAPLLAELVAIIPKFIREAEQTIQLPFPPSAADVPPPPQLNMAEYQRRNAETLFCIFVLSDVLEVDADLLERAGGPNAVESGEGPLKPSHEVDADRLSLLCRRGVESARFALHAAREIRRYLEFFILRHRLIEASAVLLEVFGDGQFRARDLSTALFYLDLLVLRDAGFLLTGANFFALPTCPAVWADPELLVRILVQTGALREEDGRLSRAKKFEGATYLDMNILMTLAKEVREFLFPNPSFSINPGWKAAMARSAASGQPQPIGMGLAMQQVVDPDPWIDAPAEQRLGSAFSAAEEQSQEPW